MSHARRIELWNNWKAYVRTFPKRYRVTHHWSENKMIACLEELVWTYSPITTPFRGPRVFTMSGVRQCWSIVEQLPAWESERAS